MSIKKILGIVGGGVLGLVGLWCLYCAFSMTSGIYGNLVGGIVFLLFGIELVLISAFEVSLLPAAKKKKKKKAVKEKSPVMMGWMGFLYVLGFIHAAACVAAIVLNVMFIPKEPGKIVLTIVFIAISVIGIALDIFNFLSRKKPIGYISMMVTIWYWVAYVLCYAWLSGMNGVLAFLCSAAILAVVISSMIYVKKRRKLFIKTVEEEF